MTNYIALEKKLINTRLKMHRAMKQKEMLTKLRNISTKIESRLPEKITDVTIKSSESLSKDGTLILPLKIRGKMLGVGRHKEKFYTVDELKKSVDVHKGKIIPLKLDHRNTEVSSTIGAVTKIFWNDAEQVIMYEGHVNDETHARNILDKVIRDVSATIYSVKGFHNLFGVIGTDLEYAELSLVEDGAYTGNSLEAVI